MLGDRPLSTPDEGRYAEIPREMNETGNYITPRLNGVKYFEKPPLLYWAEAGIIKMGGLSEFVLRLLPALLGLGGCLWLFIVASRLADPPTAWISASILATTALYYTHTRLLILDMGVSVFLSISMFSYFMATRASLKYGSECLVAGFLWRLSAGGDDQRRHWRLSAGCDYSSLDPALATLGRLKVGLQALGNSTLLGYYRSLACHGEPRKPRVSRFLLHS